MNALPKYVYVASSWRNTMQPVVVEILKAAGIGCYDFKNPEGGTGFSWREVKARPCEGTHADTFDGQKVTCRYCRDATRPGVIRAKGSDWEDVDEYLRMVDHPRAVEGFNADFAAMQRADTFVLVLPCGKSAHLELGWALGAGKRTAILLEDPVEPELMYRMADHLSPKVMDLLDWLGVQD